MERLQNITVGPRYAVRLKDLGRWDRLEAVCLRCRNKSVLDPARLLRRRPGYTRIVDLEAKLRCRACGNRNGNTLRTGRLARD